MAQFKQELNNNKEVHPLLLKAQQNALKSQIDELYEEIKEYKSVNNQEIELSE